MQEKKEMQEIHNLVKLAKEKGINLLPIMEFFTSWYDPLDTYKTLDEIEHHYMKGILSDEDNFAFCNELKGHLNFIRFLKTTMQENSKKLIILN
jgi:hypothetical protein